MTRRLAVLTVVCAELVFAGTAGDHPIENIFRPLSTPAHEISDVSFLAVIICAVIFSVVAGLLTYAIIRYRRRPGDSDAEPPQVYGSNQIEAAWTVIPLLIVFVLIMVSARVIASVQNAKPPANALHATVVGHQWWWEFRYPSLGIVTANELHVPLSDTAHPQPTFLKLESVDVAHSFWVPRLNGKTDVIPNRANDMWIDPHEAGDFIGNCAEYCGTQQANMLIHVIVQPKPDFERWVAEQQLPAAEDPSVAADKQAFLSVSCVNCHTVKGTSASGVFGPDLTHLMSRKYLASGVLSNTPENLRAWIKDPQAIKPGCLMPAMHLTDNELDSVVAYLRTLK
jgi:cytochrome c oxidase subunit 2